MRWCYHKTMKSTKSIINAGRQITLELLRSSTQNELQRIMDLGLHYSTFARLASQKTIEKDRYLTIFNCRQKIATSGLSGFKPRIFMNSNLSSSEAVTIISASLFEMARSIYNNEVPGADRSDLEVWINNELQIDISEVSPLFISSYNNDSSMIKVSNNDGNVALCSFTSLRRLVLTDV